MPLLAGFATAIALWPIFEIFYVTPVLKLMLPLRFFTWVAFAGSAVAAFEVDRLQRDAEAGRATALPLLLAAGAVLLIAAAIFIKLAPQNAVSGALVSQRRALAAAALALLAVAAAGLAPRFLWGSRPASHARRSLVSPGARWRRGETFLAGATALSLRPASAVLSAHPARRVPRETPPPYRTLGERPVLYPSTHVFAGLEDVRVHDPVERREYVELLDAA